MNFTGYFIFITFFFKCKGIYFALLDEFIKGFIAFPLRKTNTGTNND